MCVRKKEGSVETESDESEEGLSNFCAWERNEDFFLFVKKL